MLQIVYYGCIALGGAVCSFHAGKGAIRGFNRFREERKQK